MTMSLRQNQDDVRPLRFDPFQNGAGGSFEWAVDYEGQDDPDWCWAACLSNALTCVGVYVNQDEIVDRFRIDHDDDSDENNLEASDQRIPTPGDVIDLWQSYGFYDARFREEPLSRDELVKEIVEHGPVQIEVWKEKGRRHLALISGVRETANGTEVYVCDPAVPDPDWISYDEMRGDNPLPSKLGKWHWSYVGLGYRRGYLRRFHGRPSRFLAGLPDEETSNTAPVPVVPAVESPLAFQLPTDPDPPLTNELSLALYGYRHYRYRAAPEDKKEARQADLRQPLFLFESIKIWKLPYQIDFNRPLFDQLPPESYRWHHQIHDAEGKPRYYAESWYFPKLRKRYDRSWRTSWIGERWKAERVTEAIRRLDANFKGSAGTVRMLSFQRHGLVTLLLPNNATHRVVSVHTVRQTTFPLFETFEDEQLRKALAGLDSATSS
jgi:hypothetical protein